MAAQTRAIPAPDFEKKVSSSAIHKPNPWLEVINERSGTQIYGTRKHKHDFDQPRNDFDQHMFGDHHHDDDGSGLHTSFQGNRNKKQKMDKRDMIDYTHYCDVCDRGFKTDDQYKIHESQHEMCRVSDCKFVAAPKLVKLHYDMQHKTGLARKIKESSADIEKWREERRKNFPTAENIRRKQEELRERYERGDVLDNKQFGRMRGRGRGRGMRGRGHWNDRSSMGRSPYNGQGNNRGPVRSDDYDPLSRLAGASDQAPQSYINHDADDLISTSTQHALPTTSTAAPSTQTNKSSGALGSLLSSYADMSDSEEEGEIIETSDDTKNKVNNADKTVTLAREATSSSTKSNPAPSASVTKPEISEHSGSTINMSGSSEKNDSATVTKPHSPKQNLSAQEKPDSQRTGNKINSITHSSKSTLKTQQRQHQRNMNQSKSTLLEKLLAGEIRHERNVLLQCVRHVVNQNFFGIGSQASDKARTNNYDDGDVW